MVDLRKGSWVMRLGVLAVVAVGCACGLTGVTEARPLVDAPKIPSKPKPVAIRGHYSLAVQIPVIVPRSVSWLLVHRKYACTGRIAGLPEGRISTFSILGPARRAVGYFNANGKAPDAITRQWSTFATREDAYFVGCVAEWETNSLAKGKTLRATFTIGGVSGIPAARKSFSYGPICDWNSKLCKTQGWQMTR